MAAFLLLLAPVIGEAAAREALHGTAATVFAAGRAALDGGWKLAAIGTFVGVVGAR